MFCRVLLLIIVSYIIGAIPFAVIIPKLARGINIMEVGTKNPGAANVFRQVGKLWGILVWLLDTFKGVAPMFITARILTQRWIILTTHTLPIDSFFIGLAGIAAFCGHCWSPFLKFKGGRGVATSGGAFLYIIPKICPIAIITYFLMQRKPRELWVIATAFIAVLGLTVLIYWSQRIWLLPWIAVFLITAVIANISTIKEIKSHSRRTIGRRGNS